MRILKNFNLKCVYGHALYSKDMGSANFVQSGTDQRVVKIHRRTKKRFFTLIVI